MLTRVHSLVPLETTAIWGGAFQSIGNRLLRKHALESGFRPGYTIMDREDQEDLLSAVVAGEEVDTTQIRFPTGEVLGDIYSFAINTDRPLNQVIVERYRRAFCPSGVAAWCHKKVE